MPTTTCPPDLEEFVLRHTALEQPLRCTPLPGGVSSDIYLVEGSGGRVAAKRALAQLKVAAVWHAPRERSASEAGWLEVVGGLAPGFCPRPLGYTPDPGWLLMEYLDPVTHPVWKHHLLAGRVEPAVARELARRLGRVHRVTAGQPQLAQRFATDALFDALRLDPYLRALLPEHPVVADRIEAIIDRTAGTRIALVHGDVSPKNILLAPSGPVLLDAECAWWGDPAFDVAFLLTHLVSKTAHLPARHVELATAIEGFVADYTEHVDWEPVKKLLGRVSDLLPALVLARIDGKSPLEYLAPFARDALRMRALRLLGTEACDLQTSIRTLTDPLR
ncbi:MAG: aminoglycoside phosphotransferase family protein [Frankiaceae bacterium]|nr:aminoglycoside phosphotransferase family protein [Frankiaceae bacterium]